CCDREALAAGAAADGLARGLLAVAEGAIAPAPALAATGGQLTERVRRILGVPGPRCWRMRGLMASAVVPAVAVVVTACATRSEPPTASLPAAPVAVSDPGPRLPLERRIRARADGRAIVTECRLIRFDAATWARTGFAGEGPSVLAAEAVDRLLASAGDQPASPTMVTRPLQTAWATAETQMGYIGDYRRIDGTPDPVITTLRTGATIEACLEPGPDGSILVVTARYRGSDLLGLASATLTFPESASGPLRRARGFPIEEPVLRSWEGAVAGEGVRLTPDQALAIPLRMQVVRHRSGARDWAASVAEGPAIAIPDAASTPHAMLILRSRIDPGQPAPEPRLTVAPEAAWFAATRISLTAVDEPLPQVLVRLAAQLPVPTALERHPDHAATRVTITSRDEAIEDVLARLLPQTLLDAKAEPTGLRFTAPAKDTPLSPEPGGPAAGADESILPALTAAPSDLLPWPRAGDPAISRLYDVVDLLPPGPWSVDGWNVQIDPVAVTDAEALANRIRGLVPADALDGDRGIQVVAGRGLVVHAAPAVHAVVEADLAGLRNASAGPIILHVDLLDLARLTRVPQREEGQIAVAFDPPTINRLLTESRGLVPPAQLPGLPVRLHPGQRAILATTGTGWMRDVRIEATAFPSADRRYLTISLAAQVPDPLGGAPLAKRLTLTVPDAGASLVAVPQSDLALRIQAGLP
ncbi:MAG: hypothetical protein RLZZ127_3306, partial [Planctomycetota bacterium]